MQKAPRTVSALEIESALNALLLAIEAEDRRHVSDPLSSITLVSFNEFAGTELAVWLVADLVRDPVGRAYREEIKRLGKLLYRVVGSTEAMRISLDRVAAREPQNECRRSEIMDKWWSGVGAGGDIWCP